MQNCLLIGKCLHCKGRRKSKQCIHQALRIHWPFTALIPMGWSLALPQGPRGLVPIPLVPGTVLPPKPYPQFDRWPGIWYSELESGSEYIHFSLLLYLYCDERRDIQWKIAWARGKAQGRSLRDFPRAKAVIIHCISWLQSQRSVAIFRQFLAISG